MYQGDQTAPEGRALDGTETDRALVERARGGDLGAYEDLVRRHQAIAYRTATLVAGRADAEDAVQEAFVKAYRALDRFQVSGAFRPWVLQIVAREASNMRRSAGRRYGLALRVGRQPWTGSPGTTPEEDAVVNEIRTDMVTLVDELPEHERQVVACRYFLELSEIETAQVLGIPAGTVKSRLSRGLARLRSAARTAALPGVGEGVDRGA